MNRLGAILYGVVVGVIALLFARGSYWPSVYIFQEQHAPNVTLGVTGLLLSTFGPIALSVFVWLMARRMKLAWLLHLLFIPTAIVIVKVGSYLFFYGAGASGDSSPEGYALLIAIMYLLLTLLVHAAAFIVESYKTVTRGANSS